LFSLRLLSENRFTLFGRRSSAVFCVDLTALQTAQLTRLNRNRINRFYQAFRQRIFMGCRRRDVYVWRCESRWEFVWSKVNSDGWPGYDGLVELGFGHMRVNHSKQEFVRNSVHINGIEGFGAWQKWDWQSLRASLLIPFICILKKLNVDTIIGMQTKKKSWLTIAWDKNPP